jgi:tetratricopeptide (TPR) repeat protein
VLAAGDDLAARELLADLHFAARRLDEARPLYAALLAAAVKAKKRGKELARLHTRLGEIAEKQGDAAAALASLTEAQKIDGGHAPTLVAIGRLQRARGDWEAARKVYRNLLMQTLDADAGITKGGIYLALGDIHEKLNEGPKAIQNYERGLELEPNGPTQDELRAAIARLRAT